VSVNESISLLVGCLRKRQLLERYGTKPSEFKKKKKSVVQKIVLKQVTNKQTMGPSRQAERE